MTTVKQLREYLATLPDDLPVEVVAEHVRGYAVSTDWVPLVLPNEQYPYTSTCDPFLPSLCLGSR